MKAEDAVKALSELLTWLSEHVPENGQAIFDIRGRAVSAAISALVGIAPAANELIEHAALLDGMWSFLWSTRISAEAALGMARANSPPPSDWHAIPMAQRQAWLGAINAGLDALLNRGPKS